MTIEKELVETRERLGVATSRLAELTVQHQNKIAELNQVIATLRDQLSAPYETRRITVAAFLNRLQPGELLWLFSDPDDGVGQIAAMLKNWSANSWPIDLDSDQFVGAMQYLQSTEKLTAERVAQLTANASRAESQG